MIIYKKDTYKKSIESNTLVCLLFMLLLVAQLSLANCLRCGDEIPQHQQNGFEPQVLCDRCLGSLSTNFDHPNPIILFTASASANTDMVIDFTGLPRSPRKRVRAAGSNSSLQSSPCLTKHTRAGSSLANSDQADFGSEPSDDDLSEFDEVFETSSFSSFINLLEANHFSPGHHIQIQQLLEDNRFFSVSEGCLFEQLTQGHTIFQVSWDLDGSLFFHQLSLTDECFISEDILGVTQEFESLSSLKNIYPEQSNFMWFHHRP